MINFNGYKFRGKHATYAKYLTTDRGQMVSGRSIVFERIMDVYMISALIGLSYGKRSTIDDSVNDSSDIPMATMVNEKDKLLLIYRIVMLYDKSQNLTEKERIDRAFKKDNDETALTKNMQLFNSYVLGGLEIIYDTFKDYNDDNEDEKYDKMLDMIGLLENL